MLPACSVRGGDFFRIQKIDYLTEPPRKGQKFGVIMEKMDPKTKKKVRVIEFFPMLEVRVATGDQIRSLGLTAKAYFYDEAGTLLATVASPSQVTHGTGNYALPAFFEKGKRENIYFVIPEAVLKSKWKSLVVFGDKNEAVAETFPKAKPDETFEYPEKNLVENDSGEKVERTTAIDPLVELAVETDNPAQPKITMFMRPPQGVTQGKDVRGMMALCLLANNLEEIRLFMLNQSKDGKEQNNAILKFADNNKLAIIAWGSRRAWVLKGSYYEFDKNELKFMDQSFDEVAKAWEKGVKSFSRKYGVPDKDYLLWAMSGAANWAHRLALRKPQYFAAVHVEILTTYDKPTPEAKNVMWLLTTGELEGGYESSKRFYKDCKNLGYPILYKAYPGIGHAGCPQATALGLQFFKFALEEIEETKGIRENPVLRPDEIPEVIYSRRMEAFQKAPFYGDIVNQEIFSAEKQDMIPAGFQVPLPNETLAKLWIKQ